MLWGPGQKSAEEASPSHNGAPVGSLVLPVPQGHPQMSTAKNSQHSGGSSQVHLMLPQTSLVLTTTPGVGALKLVLLRELVLYYFLLWVASTHVHIPFKYFPHLWVQRLLTHLPREDSEDQWFFALKGRAVHLGATPGIVK